MELSAFTELCDGLLLAYTVSPTSVKKPSGVCALRRLQSLQWIRGSKVGPRYTCGGSAVWPADQSPHFSQHTIGELCCAFHTLSWLIVLITNRDWVNPTDWQTQRQQHVLSVSPSKVSCPATASHLNTMQPCPVKTRGTVQLGEFHKLSQPLV